MQKPIVVLTLAYVAGILLGRAFLYFPYSTAILVIFTILIAGILVRLNKLTLQRSLLVAVPALFGLAAYLYSAAWLPADHYTRLFPEDKARHTITGKIISALDRDPDRTAFILEAKSIDGHNVSGRLRVSVREAVTSIGYNDLILITGRIYRPGRFMNPGGFDYTDYLAQNGIYRIASVKNGDQIQILAPGKGIFRTIQDWRERIRQAFLASTSGPGAAILQAMVLGEEGMLTDDIRDDFLAAGVTHIISISGSHLGMVAVICFGLIRLLMQLLPERSYHRVTLYADPKKIAAWITLPLVVFYTLLAGGQTATVRSLIMIIAALAGLILDRENAIIYSLAAAALFILVPAPQALFDISFQLSFISVLTIGSVVSVWNELPSGRSGALKRLGRSTILLVVISFSTSVATGPLVAHYFSQFSLTGIVSNIIVVPFAGMVVVPLGLFSGILSLFTGYLPAAGVNQFFADAFVKIVEYFSRLPIAEFHPRSPGIVWLLCYAALIMAFFIYIRGRLLFAFKPFEYSSRISNTVRIALIIPAAFLILITGSALVPNDILRVCFPDVGQGDSALIEIPGGKNILIDGGGTQDDRFDIGRRILAPYLWKRGVHSLDLVILSHPHPDHMNGLKFILKKFDVAEVWTHQYDSDLPGYEDFKTLIEKRHIKHTIVSSEDPVRRIGQAELRVLHPSPLFHSFEKKAYSAENDRSLVVRLAFPDRVLIFTGDIGSGAENFLVRTKGDLKCDLLKVPHHGSKTSSSEAFVSAARPAASVVTVGRQNPYHHPADEVLQRYERHGSRILRTDRDGALILAMHDAAIDVTSWNDLELRRIELKDHGIMEREQENWKRLWIRKWEL